MTEGGYLCASGRRELSEVGDSGKGKWESGGGACYKLLGISQPRKDWVVQLRPGQVQINNIIPSHHRFLSFFFPSFFFFFFFFSTASR